LRREHHERAGHGPLSRFVRRHVHDAAGDHHGGRTAAIEIHGLHRSQPLEFHCQLRDRHPQAVRRLAAVHDQQQDATISQYPDGRPRVAVLYERGGKSFAASDLAFDQEPWPAAHCVHDMLPPRVSGFRREPECHRDRRTGLQHLQDPLPAAAVA